MKTKNNFRLVELVPTVDLEKPNKTEESLLKAKSDAEKAYEKFEYLKSLGIVNCLWKKTVTIDADGKDIAVDKIYSKGVLNTRRDDYYNRYISNNAIPRSDIRWVTKIANELNKEPIRLAEIINNYQEKIQELICGAKKELPKELESFFSSSIFSVCASKLADDSKKGYTEYWDKIWFETVECEKDQNFRKKYNNLTRVGLEQVKLLCDKLDFIIVPLEYLSKEAYKVDERFKEEELENKISEFKKMCDKIFVDKDHQEYVVCPIQFLDLLSWTRNKENKDVYFGKGLSIYSTTIQMNIPVFKSLWGNIENLNERVSELEDLTKSIKSQVEVLNTNLNNLQSQVSEIGRQVADLKIQQASLDVRVESLEDWRRCMLDPMIFSMPTKKLLKERDGSDLGVVGFCWGPDFPEQFVHALGIATASSLKSDIKNWL